MNKQYQNDLEASLYYANKEIDRLKKQKQEVLDFIEQKCVYDSHLLGYTHGLERKDTSILVYKLTGKYPRDIEREKNEKR